MTVIFIGTISQLRWKITLFRNRLSKKPIIKFFNSDRSQGSETHFIMKLLPIVVIISVLKFGTTALENHLIGLLAELFS
jgi:hypothetical protein